MPSDDPNAPPRRAYIRFSAKIAREVCVRIAAGESQRSICADPAMPCLATLRAWSRERLAFAKVFARARVMGGRDGKGPASTYDAVTAFEIVARVSEGEPLTAISDDPAMPSARTIFLWRKTYPEFEEELRVAREAVAERFSDLGWKLAMEATPETAYLTRVRLGQLRWQAALLAPRTHARLKPAEAPEPPQTQTVSLRTFATEVHPETGQVRGVAMHFDPERGEVVRDSVGEWRDPPFPLRRGIDYAAAKQARLEQGLPTHTDPSTWE